MLLGGVLTSGLGWRWVLLINVPIVVAVILFAHWALTESRVEDRMPNFDVPGAVSVTTGLGLLVYAIVGVQDFGLNSPIILAALTGAVILLTAFVVIEARSRAPLIPLSIFRLPALRAANVVCLLCFMALLAMSFFLSLYLQQILGYRALTAGLAYLPLSVSILTAGILGLGILASIAAAHTTSDSADRAAALTDSYQLAYLAAAGFTGLGIIATLALFRDRRFRRRSAS